MPAQRPSQRIADDLRAAIARGEYQPGDRLPTQAELRERYGVAAQTAANAGDLLKAEGLAVGRVGSGLYVRDRRPIIRLARNRLSRAERQAGRGFFLTDADLGGWVARSDVTVRTEPAATRVAEELRIEPGVAVLVRDRVMYADDQPVQLATSYLPRSITAGTAIEETNSGPGGIYARLEEIGHVLTHYRETIGQGQATEQEASALGVAPGAELWRIVRVAYAATGPVEVNFIAPLSDRVELIYELPAE